MDWKKIPAAAKDWAGGVHPKTLYTAIHAGELKVARIGPAGRNMLTCEPWVDAWLEASAKKKPRGQGADVPTRLHPVA